MKNRREWTAHDCWPPVGHPSGYAINAETEAERGFLGRPLQSVAGECSGSAEFILACHHASESGAGFLGPSKAPRLRKKLGWSDEARDAIPQESDQRRPLNKKEALDTPADSGAAIARSRRALRTTSSCRHRLPGLRVNTTTDQTFFTSPLSRPRSVRRHSTHYVSFSVLSSRNLR